MLIGHFSELAPVCPTCRIGGREAALVLSTIEAEASGDVEAGLLLCQACGQEYPILDGVPVIVPDLPRYIQDNLFYLVARGDLPAAVAGALGDLAGPASALDAIRQHLSSYAWDHWGDQAPSERDDDARPGDIVRLVETGLGLLDVSSMPDGPILDVGCGVGRSVAELARRTGRMVLGVDLSVPLARFARTALKTRSVSYDLRRIGLAYNRRRFDIGLSWPRGAVDVWLCDLLALPFRSGSFAMVAGFNVVDCLSDPQSGVAAVARVLKADGGALLCTPFDWSGSVTPPAAWLGGHSRGGGAPEQSLAQALRAGTREGGTLQKIRTVEVAWHLRLHERAKVCYRAHLVAARCVAATAAGEAPSCPPNAST